MTQIHKGRKNKKTKIIKCRSGNKKDEDDLYLGVRWGDTKKKKVRSEDDDVIWDIHRQDKVPHHPFCIMDGFKMEK